MITRSVAIDDNFIIELSPASLSIKDLEITLPLQMTNLEGIKITDKSGQEVKAEIQNNEDQVLISFNEFVKPETALRIEFTDIDTQSVMGETLFYRLRVQKSGLLERIPVGTAIIQVQQGKLKLHRLVYSSVLFVGLILLVELSVKIRIL